MNNELLDRYRLEINKVAFLTPGGVEAPSEIDFLTETKDNDTLNKNQNQVNSKLNNNRTYRISKLHFLLHATRILVLEFRGGGNLIKREFIQNDNVKTLNQIRQS